MNSNDLKDIVEFFLNSNFDPKTEALNNGINIQNINFNQASKTVWTEFFNEALNQSSEESDLILNFLSEHVKDYPKLMVFIDKIHNLEFNDKIANLRSSISNKTVILFLGNRFFKYRNNDDNVPFNVGLSNHLYQKLKSRNITVDERYKDNLFYIAQKYENIQSRADDLLIESNDFYESKMSCFLKDKYEIISKLNFKHIINFNYDSFLNTYLNNHVVLDNQNDISEKIMDLEKQNIINILGCFQEGKKNECVLTEIGLINIITNIIKNNFNIKSLTNQGRVFLFLGFDFEQWYVKVFLNIILNISNSTLINKKDYYSLKHNIEGSSKEILLENYNFYFFEDNQTDQVLELLKP